MKGNALYQKILGVNNAKISTVAFSLSQVHVDGGLGNSLSTTSTEHYV